MHQPASDQLPLEVMVVWGIKGSGQVVVGGEKRRRLFETSGTDRWRLCPFAPPRLSSRMSESIVEPQLQPPLSPPLVFCQPASLGRESQGRQSEQFVSLVLGSPRNLSLARGSPHASAKRSFGTSQSQ